LREDFHVAFGGDGVPVPVASIAEDFLGLAIEERELGDVSGLLYPAERRIVVNSAETAGRRRFTLAHEIGHWICHCVDGTERPVFCRAEEVTLDPDAKAVEREANVFAAELLMPEESVRGAWAGEVAPVADELGVSRTALHWRAYGFGLIGEPPT
jgi:Zn-dependent peptidase ImmA (M78 family)